MNKQTKQKPVAYVHLEKWLDGQLWPEDAFSEILFEGMTPLYTAPPKREWVGLTKDEIIDIIIEAFGSPYDVAVDVEAKLKERNT